MKINYSPVKAVKMNQEVSLVILDDIEEPKSFISMMQRNGFTVLISRNQENNSDIYKRSEYTTEYDGVKILIKNGTRNSDDGIISVLHIYGNKLYLCGTTDLVDYSDIILRETMARQ